MNQALTIENHDVAICNVLNLIRLLFAVLMFEELVQDQHGVEMISNATNLQGQGPGGVEASRSRRDSTQQSTLSTSRGRDPTSKAVRACWG